MTWRRLSKERLSWLDVQALTDPIHFYKSHPLTSLGLADTGSVKTMQVRFRNQLDPDRYRRLKFGRLDERGRPETRNYIGLYPAGYVLGLYGGAVVPMPANLAPNYADCRFRTQAAYRVSLSEAQYRRLTREVRRVLADPPRWHMAAYNCNHFGASLGAVVGLQAPRHRLLPAFAYIHALIEANEGPRDSGA